MILGGQKLPGVEKMVNKIPKKKSERLDQIEQENGWQKFKHHKWYFRGHSTVGVARAVL